MSHTASQYASRRTVLAFAVVLALAFLATPAAKADSYTGSLSTPEDTYSLVFNVTGTVSELVTAQTFGFGGGTNGAGTVIAPGGFDSFLGFFSGTGLSASLVTDALGNPLATSDDLANFGSYMGCPPAGTVNLGGSTCGDIILSASLAPGTYTLLLTDAAYISNAANNGSGTIGDGFTRLHRRRFPNLQLRSQRRLRLQNDTFQLGLGCSPVADNTVPTPEPSSLALLCAGARCRSQC